jgi:hypothetical protein
MWRFRKRKFGFVTGCLAEGSNASALRERIWTLIMRHSAGNSRALYSLRKNAPKQRARRKKMFHPIRFTQGIDNRIAANQFFRSLYRPDHPHM